MKRMLFLVLQVICILACEGYGRFSTPEVVDKILNLTEDEFFSADQSVLAPRESQLLDMDFFGVVINAPKQISTERHDKLPLIMAIRLSGDRGWDVSLADNCILVGTNLQDGSVHFACGLISEKELQNRGYREKVPKGPKPSGLALAAAQLTELDARGRLNMNWNTGTWALGVLYYDWLSNIVLVELKNNKPAQCPPISSIHPLPNPDIGTTEKRFFGLLKREKLVFPSYLPNSKTPKLTKPGLSFVIDTKFKDGIQLTVHGAFSTITKAHYIPETITTHIFADGKKHKVGAVVPLTLAVVGLDWDVPIRFDWAIPVYSNQKIQPGAPLQGYFSIDVLSGFEGKLPGGSYVAYIIMDGVIYGPQKFQWPESY